MKMKRALKLKLKLAGGRKAHIGFQVCLLRFLAFLLQAGTHRGASGGWVRAQSELERSSPSSPSSPSKKHQARRLGKASGSLLRGPPNGA